MILDLFAGPGGWDMGCRWAGRDDVIGIELEKNACLTRAAAGLKTIRADVSTYPTAPFVGKVDGLIASPPCQSFSLAGNGRGGRGLADDRGQLVYQVLRWVDALRPEWVACEQVPPVLPIWRLFAKELGAWGYATWTGILNSANYGVPQTRERAFLLASRSGAVSPPEPTHAKEEEPPSLFGEGRQRWVTMAEALGWGLSERPATTLMAGQGREGGACPLDGGSGARATYAQARERGKWVVEDSRGEGFGRSAEFDAGAQPSRTLTSKARSWTVRTSKPSGNSNKPGHSFKTGNSSSTAHSSETEELLQVDSLATGGEQLSYGSLAAPGELQFGGSLERHGEHNHHDSLAGCGELQLSGSFAHYGELRSDDYMLRAGSESHHAHPYGLDGPAPTIAFAHDSANWAWERPSTTIVGQFRPDMIAPPGWRVDPEVPRQKAPGAVRVEPWEAGVLQSFPKDFPWQGARTRQFEQIGNAVPPLWAKHIVSVFL